MPAICAVPSCKSGSRRIKRKYSMFKVPKDKTLRKKWEEAIPGAISLRDKQLICSKHFTDDCIITKFVKKDIYGNIIIEKDYQQVRLSETAVPTIFTEDNFEVAVKSMDVDVLEHNYCKLHTFDEDLVVIRDKMIENNNLFQEKLEYSLEMQVEEVIEESIFDNLHENCNDAANVQNIEYIQIQSSENSIILSPNTAEVNSIREKKNTAFSDSNMAKSDDTSSVSFIQVDCVTTIYLDNQEIKVPKTWGVVEKVTQSEKKLVFTQLLTTIINNVEMDVLQKHFTLNLLNGSLKYFAHGKVIQNIDPEQLPPKLCHSASLLKPRPLAYELYA